MADHASQRPASSEAANQQNEKTSVSSPSSPADPPQPSKASKLKLPKIPKLSFDTFFTYIRLLFYANPTWLDVLLIAVGTVTAAAAGTPFPLMGILFGELIDEMNTATCEGEGDGDPASAQSAINERVLTIVYISIGAFFLIYIYFLSWSLVSQRLAHRLRERYFLSLLRQEASFFDDRQAGEVSSRLNSDVSMIQSGTSEKVGIFIATISFFITAYVIGFIKYAPLAAMLLSLIPAFLIMSVVCGGFVQKYSGLMSDKIAAASSIASEALSNVAVVQAFAAGPRLEAKFGGYMLEAHRQGLKKAVWAGVQAGLLYFIAFSANALAYWQGTIAITDNANQEGGVTVGAIYTVVFLIVDACVMLGGIAPLLPLFGAASAAFLKLREDIELQSSINGTTDEGQKLPSTTPAGVEFHNVTFSYPSRPDNPVLKNVSFSCPAGQYTALVGLSGSGKSTVAGLTTRLYDPHQGSVVLDGHNLRDLNVRNLRSFISLVQQEPSLLDRSILENIALGLVNSPREEHERFKAALHGPYLAKLAEDVKGGMDLVAAARSYGDDMVEIAALIQNAAALADASSFIGRLEHGFGTLVGTGGKLLSGGQRQRVALARALIRDPKILILDEATASLDSTSERRIQEAVERTSKGRTLISIAHRLSTIKNADNIIVMSAGEVVEQGSHSELISRNGAYAKLVNLQNLSPADDEDTPSRASTSVESLDDTFDEKAALDPVDAAKAMPKEVSGDGDPEKKEEAESSAEQTDATLDQDQSGWKVLKSMGRMIRPNLLWLVMAVIAAFIVGCTFTASGAVFGHAIGASSPCNEPDYIRSRGAFLAGMFFMLAAIELLANTMSWSAFGYIAEKLLYRIRVLSFRSLFQQDVEWHQSKNRNPTTLLSVITKDAAAIGGFSGSIMGTAFAVVVNLLVAIIVSHIIAWRIAIVCLVTIPLLLGSGIMQLRVLSKFEAKHAEAYATAVGITVEAVNSMKTVSTLSLEHEVFGTYKRALGGPKKDILVASSYANIWLAISNSVGTLVYAFAYWWGSRQIIEGRYTQTEFLIILVAMMVGASLWGQMFSLAPEVSKARAAASRIFNLLDLNSSTSVSGKRPDLPAANSSDLEAKAESKPKPNSARGGVSVAFRDVSFAYPARQDVQILQHMSFTIQAGQFCGLVGPSGAGKSTIMALVQRMYRASSGTVEVDGKDVSRLDGTEFRDDMAVVPQDSALFDGSVRFNVGLGARPGTEATDAEIEEACRLANIHDTIVALPDGYDTECGPNGSQLSGGQRQRVAIARALVRKPRLLLLDESTSALDAESEKALQEGLERAARGITVIAIAHRLHTVRKADVILVCEAGAVVARGRHEELMERSESYRVNAMQQMLGN